jgi:hypothetical protein
MAIRTATTNVILKTHAAFQFTKRILWDLQGPDITAQDALTFPRASAEGRPTGPGHREQEGWLDGTPGLP